MEENAGMMKQMCRIQWAVLFLDTFIFWMCLFFIVEEENNGGIYFFPLSGVITYLCTILILYAFRSYSRSRLIRAHESLIALSQGLLVGMLITTTITASLLPAKIYLVKLFFFCWCAFSVVRLFAWSYMRIVIPKLEILVIGSMKQWKAVSELSNSLKGKICPVAYCDPSMKSINAYLTRYPEISTVLIADRRFLNNPFVRKRCNLLRRKKLNLEFLPTFIEEYFERVSLPVTKEFGTYYELLFQNVVPVPSQRLFNVILSAIILLLAIPIMAVIAVLIVLDSGFPIIFRQERVGLNGARFILHKFRTMKNDSGDHRPAFANEEVHRITRLGCFLRAMHLDELPQLWDVLMGHMNLIGPRPEQPVFVEQFSDEIAFYNYRHMIRPGITGWAQINFSYASTVEETKKKLEYDLYYVKNRSLMLDLEILMKTIETVLNLREIRSWRKGITEKGFY